MPDDVFRVYNFKLAFQPGITVAHFTEVSGLGAKVNAIKYREGGNNAIVRTLPGYVEYADVTLRYGITNSSELWNWFMSGVNGNVQRRNASIIILDTDGTRELIRWNLTNAWVTEWRGTFLNAMTNEVAVESMTLVYEALTRS
jgi:phage tail-like protein